MGSFSLSGGVEVFGFISPSNTTDQYPVIDPLYGIDGLRNVNTLSDLNLIPTLRRRAGMLVGVSGGTIYYKLKVAPWNNTITDWELFELGSNFTGGTVTGATIFTNGLTANTISATTYENLPLDVFVTGGTFSGGDIIFTNNTGGTFNVSGISSFDTFVTGFSYNNNTFTISQNSGSSLSTTINSVTGLTVGGTINSTTFSGGTYFGDGSNLTGIIRGSGGGRVFYFNLSNTQTPYYEFSPSATTQPEQSITTSAITSGSTSTIAGFLTPPNALNITQIVGGVWTFFVHSYKEDITSDFDIFCEVYKRTTGGTETFLFQTDPAPITSVSPTPSMEITDGYFSGTSLDITDRLLVKVNVTNLGSTSKTATFVTEGNVHYSYSTSSLYIPSVDTFTTGFTYNNNTLTIQRNEGLSDLSVSINSVTGLTVNGNLSVTGNTIVRGLTGTTALISGSGQNILTIVGSGSTQPLFTVQGSSGELFSVTDSLVGSLFSVNDISGLPILEVFSNNTILMGSYLAPSLYTTTRVSLSAGTNTIYSIPTSAYTGAFFDYTLISSGATGARSGNIMSIWSGSSVNFTETQTTDIGTTTGVTFNMGIVGSNAVLSSSATTAGWTVKTIIKSI
jgi:hypothetical protein